MIAHFIYYCNTDGTQLADNLVVAILIIVYKSCNALDFIFVITNTFSF